MTFHKRWRQGILGDDYPESSHRWPSIPDDLLKIIVSHLGDNRDRGSFARVCRQWHDAESYTRPGITVNFCYAVSPDYVIDRFGQLRSIKIKGKPRASDFGLIPHDWGGYGGPWIAALARARAAKSCFSSLESIHLKRMELSDDDLALLGNSFGDKLRILKLEKCAGFSSRGLEIVARSCRDLRVLSLDESDIDDTGSQWLRELVHSCGSLEALSLSLTSLELGDIRLVEKIVSSSKLKTLMLDLDDSSMSNQRLDLRQSSIQELGFCGDIKVSLPPTLTAFSGDLQWPVEANLGNALAALNLLYTTATHEQHLAIIKSCPRLQVLKARDIIGDVGLELVAGQCKGLRSIRIENMRQQEEHGFSVSNTGLLALARGCVHLQSLSVYVRDVENSSLEAFAKCCPELVDFRLGILEAAPDMADSLDTGIKSLLQSCRGITKLALYLKGGLTDTGLENIGRFGHNLKWILLGCLRQSETSDNGLISLARGCENLQKLEMRNCPFSDAGIVYSIHSLPLLRYVWFQGYQQRNDLHFALLSPEWRIEVMPDYLSVLCYRSLISSSRGDHPPYVRPMLGLNARFGARGEW